jgi:AcrR family transcriptional regulator
MRRQTVEERRAEILDATCDVVIERGFAGTRVADVANKLNVSTGLIHYHFDSKEQLLAEAFAYAARQEMESLEEDLATVPNVVAKLDKVLQNYIPDHDEVDWLMWIDSWGEALRNPQMRTISQELDIQSTDLIERIIVEGVTAGEFSCGDPHGTALCIAGLVDGLSVQLTIHDKVISREALLGHARRIAAAELGISANAFSGSAAPGSGTPRRTAESG